VRIIQSELHHYHRETGAWQMTSNLDGRRTGEIAQHMKSEGFFNYFEDLKSDYVNIFRNIAGIPLIF
jgi:hypothetical protein